MMTGKHAKKKYKAKRRGVWWIVVIEGSEVQVPGTPAYESKSEAQRHADKLNK
jgi:hypothetical protein